MRFERFCRSIPFELGYRLHCPNGSLESADAKTEQSESRARPRKLSVSPTMLLSSDRKSTRLNSSHSQISYAVFCLKKKRNKEATPRPISPQPCPRSRTAD